MRNFICVIAAATSLLTCCELTSEESPPRIEVGPRQKKIPKKAPSSSKKQSSPSILTKSTYQNISSFRPFYYLKGVGVQGRTVSTADETVWEITSFSSYTTAYWQPGTPLIIQPNTSLFASSDYYLYNTLTHECAEANLSQGPFLNYCVLITHINYYSGYVQLSNGTEWFVNQSQLAHWQLNQAVLIGENTAWFGPKFILVNVNENNYITADLWR